MLDQKAIDRINQIFIDKFELDASLLTPDTRIFEDLGLDSLDIVDLITGLQHTLQVPLRDNKALLEIRTIGDVYAFVETLANEDAALRERISQN